MTLAVIAPLLAGQDVQAVDYSASITTSGNKSINVSPRASGTGTTISADNINVQTTCQAGYNLTIGTSVNDNNLYLGGDSTINTSGAYFSPVDGATALNSTTNAWGYYYNSSTTPTESSVFSAVPASSSTAATIITPTASATDINDNFNVYYGVSVASSMNTGTYKMVQDDSNKDGTIVYYLTMADECTSYKVQYNPTGADNNGVLRTGTGTMTDQLIKENIATNLTANTFTAPSGYYFAGWNTAQDGSGDFYNNSAEVMDLAGIGENIILYAQWSDCPGAKVCYNANAVTGVDGTMGEQRLSRPTKSISLLPSNYSRVGYGFKGWNTRMDGTGEMYGPTEKIEITAGRFQDGGLSLYAMWAEPAKDSGGNEITFQTDNLLTTTLIDGTTLASKENGYVTALRDTRDNQVYAVAKLADGKYWMIENLRLDDTAELTADNTNNPSLPLTNLLDQSTSPATVVTSSNHLSASSKLAYDGEAAPEGWCKATSAACYDQSRLRTDNTTERATSPTSGSGALYSYGNYYNWYSATAGNGKYNTSTNNLSVSGDICASGWRLPRGGNKSNETENDIWQLVVNGLNGGIVPANYSSSNNPYYANGEEADSIKKILKSYPNNFVTSGYAEGSSILRGGVWIWTSTAENSYYAYMFDFVGDLRLGNQSYNKYSGLPIRCLLSS